MIDCILNLNYKEVNEVEIIKQSLDLFLEPVDKNALSGHESIPKLASIIKDESYISLLLEKAKQCPPDYNGGIALGIALHGNKYTETFKKTIWDENFDNATSGTGMPESTFLGMNYLNISIAELFNDILDDVENKVESNIVDDKITILYNIIECKIYSSKYSELNYINYIDESFISISKNIYTRAEWDIIEIYTEYCKEDIYLEELYHQREINRLYAYSSSK